MSKGGGSSGGSSTTRMELPQWLDDALRAGTQNAQQAYGNAQAYPYTTQAPMRAETKQGLGEMAFLSHNPNLAGRADVLNTYGRTARGDFLYGNPGFNAAFNAAANQIQPRVTSAFNQAGRMGGIAGQGELTRQLGDSFANLYNSERGRQMQALGMADQMQQLAYAPAARKMQVGQALQEDDQRQIADRLYRWDFPRMNASDYMQALSMAPINAYASQTTSQKAPKGSAFKDILGAGLSLAGMFF